MAHIGKFFLSLLSLICKWLEVEIKLKLRVDPLSHLWTLSTLSTLASRSPGSSTHKPLVRLPDESDESDEPE